MDQRAALMCGEIAPSLLTRGVCGSVGCGCADPPVADAQRDDPSATDAQGTYPSITLLAMVHFSTMFNGGFQERTFSSCKHVRGVGQTRIPMDTLEMKALLFHNAELIRNGII